MKTKKSLVIALIIALIVVFIAVVLFVPAKKSKEKAGVGLISPDFELKAPEGKIWRLKDTLGSVVLINFWASWCQSCKDEMPYLQNLYSMTQGSEPILQKGLRIITILYKDNPEDAIRYLSQNKYNLPLLIDSRGEVSLTYGLTGVPETFIVDKNGILREILKGPVEFDSPQAVAFYTKLIRE
ncbi:MAG: TlpA family protein disulfide reductase [Nitrospirae bacterium]|nr:TlpA family protein disulfide reductase [Nitrospirota bacterium]